MILNVLLVLIALHPASMKQTVSDQHDTSRYFAEVGRKHWAYGAIKELKPLGVRIWSEHGSTTLTRYEIAVLLDRTLKGALYVKQGQTKHPSLSQKMYEALARLTTEFRAELNLVGTSRYKVDKQLGTIREWVEKK